METKQIKRAGLANPRYFINYYERSVAFTTSGMPTAS